MNNSIYIHIPFCKNICSYCDFNKIYYNKEIVDRYLKALEDEIASKYQNELIKTIYIGGGTPSCLSLEQLEKLFNIINRFNTSKELEYTIECNFDSTNYQKLQLFKKYNINRLSFGIETINRNLQTILNRNENPNNIKTIISDAKKLGFDNINVDLIYAIKNESIEELNNDLDFVLSLDITHISTYSLIIEEHTKLFIDNYKPISSDIDRIMYDTIINKLESSDYKHYEISNFAKDGYYSKHNLCYWNNDYYYGFGMGAASYINNRRTTNTKSITKYLKNNYIYQEEKLSKKDKMIYEVILSLRLIDGIDKKSFYQKYNISIDKVFNYKSLKEKNLITENENNIFITKDNLYISNYIIEEFIYE